jgi:hypothetical protein
LAGIEEAVKKTISAFEAALKTSYTVLAKQKRCSLKKLLRKAPL